MTTVLVQTHGTRISSRGGKLLLESDQTQREVPLGHVSELVVMGHARISTAVVAELVERGIPLHMQVSPDQLPISIHPPNTGQVAALQNQFTASPARKLQAAQLLIGAKVRNSNWVLRRIGHTTRLELGGIEGARNADELRGAEGQAAARYFAALGDLLPAWNFRRRVYRPTPDPVNAALSFAYTLLLGRTLQAVVRSGLHPAAGTLHVSHRQRPALALDIMEPFRGPVCDLTVLGLLRSGQLPQDQFQQRGNQVRLGKLGCQKVAEAIAQRVDHWKIQPAIAQQIRAVRAVWVGQEGEAWQPPVRA